MAIKIGIANRKGGIGKSSTALALAAGLQNRGYKVLMKLLLLPISAHPVYTL